MSPVARRPAPPVPPSNRGLGARVLALDTMLTQIEVQRQSDATLAVSIATTTSQLERNEALELSTLPSVTRRAFENLVYTALSMTRGQPPEMQLQMVRAMYMTARVVSEAYELEGADDPAPQT